MLYSKKIKEITFKDIIEAKIKFATKNDIFSQEEFRNSNEGEILGYNQMLEDVEILQVQAFIEKYIKILNDINKKLDENLINDNKEVEKLAGYNNAIVSVLELIDPIYRYKIN